MRLPRATCALAAPAPGAICQSPPHHSAAPPAPGRPWPVPSAPAAAPLLARGPPAASARWRRPISRRLWTPLSARTRYTGTGVGHALERLRAQVCAREAALHQAIGGGADHHRIGCGKPLQPRRHVGRLAQRQLFLPGPAAHLTHHHQAGMDAHTHGQPDAAAPASGAC